MDLQRLEELLFAPNGACVSESPTRCRAALSAAAELLRGSDSSALTPEEYLRFTSVFIRFSVTAASLFHEEPGYGQVLAHLYQLALDSPFYQEREV